MRLIPNPPAFVGLFFTYIQTYCLYVGTWILRSIFPISVEILYSYNSLCVNDIAILTSIIIDKHRISSCVDILFLIFCGIWYYANRILENNNECCTILAFFNAASRFILIKSIQILGRATPYLLIGVFVIIFIMLEFHTRLKYNVFWYWQ